MDFANICRTCLYADSTLFSVFDPVVSEMESNLGCAGATAAEMLKSFTSLVIASEDQMSTKICTTCLDEVHRTYVFKLKCESSQIALKVLLEEFPAKSNYIMPKLQMPPNRKPPAIVEQNDRNENSDLLQIAVSDLDDLEVEPMANDGTHHNLPLDEFSEEEAQMLNMNLDLDSLNDITMELETMDNIIIEYGDPLAKPKKTPEKWKEGFFECPGCQKGFTKIGLLRSHIVDVHTDGKLCKICSEEYKGSIWKHIYAHMPNKDFPCSDCNRSFHSQYNLQMHRKMAHIDFLTCEHCSMRFRNMQKFRDHVFQHTGKHEFQCDICLKVLKRKSGLLLHMQSHAGERSFHCQQCSKSFGYKHNLTFHMITAHGLEKLPYRCEICSKRFKNRPQLIKHKFEHNGNTELQCDVCNQVFESKYKVELHRKKHTGEKPLKCEICGTGFRLKCNLKEHMGVHSDDKPFACSICPNRYKRTYLLTRHMKAAHPGALEKSGNKTL